MLGKQEDLTSAPVLHVQISIGRRRRMTCPDLPEAGADRFRGDIDVIPGDHPDVLPRSVFSKLTVLRMVQAGSGVHRSAFSLVQNFSVSADYLRI